MPAQLTTIDDQRIFEAYIEALFKSGDDISVHNQLGELDVPPPYRARVKVLYSPVSPAAIVDGLVEQGSIKRLSGQSRTYVYHTTIGRENLRELRVPFFMATFPDNSVGSRVQAMIGVCKTDQWKVLRRLTRNNYPDLVPILLSQSELIQSAKRLKKRTGHDVHVKAFSGYESLREGMGRRRKSIREWTDEELDEALLVIQDRGQIINSLDVDFFPKIGAHAHISPRTRCKIRKEGEIEVSGNFNLAFDAVATQVGQIGERKLGFFSKRGLRESAYKPHPLAVNFSRPVLENLEVVRNFVQVLTKYPHSMYAIEHGNPYAHVKLTDLFDGSSFDVWAIPPQRIALIPGLKASEAACERLIHYIFDAFREGQLANYDHEGRTFDGVA